MWPPSVPGTSGSASSPGRTWRISCPRVSLHHWRCCCCHCADWGWQVWSCSVSTLLLSLTLKLSLGKNPSHDHPLHWYLFLFPSTSLKPPPSTKVKTSEACPRLISFSSFPRWCQHLACCSLCRDHLILTIFSPLVSLDSRTRVPCEVCVQTRPSYWEPVWACAPANPYLSRYPLPPPPPHTRPIMG